jgi:hypothetical protein
MLRNYVTLSALGLFGLVLLVSLDGSGKLVAGLLPDSGAYNVLVRPNNGQPVTLEMVQKDVQWHRDTARKLRELD